MSLKKSYKKTPQKLAPALNSIGSLTEQFRLSQFSHEKCFRNWNKIWIHNLFIFSYLSNLNLLLNLKSSYGLWLSAKAKTMFYEKKNFKNKILFENLDKPG